MPKQNQTSGKTGFVVGRAAFKKICAVEGIQLKPLMEKRAAKAKSKGLSAEEYREMILRAYRKA